MKIIVGSKNPVKVNAVKEIIKNYDILSSAEVAPVSAQSEVSEQPKSIDETIRGAMNRAKNSFADCDYSFGIEDGLMHVPQSKTDYMNVCVCVIYDGKDYHIGLGSAFEYPREMIRLILDKNVDVDQAAFETGITKNPDIGSFDGMVNILTKGRLTRKEYTKQAIMTALIHLENVDLF